MMRCIIDQYVADVTDFSSQYGSCNSISYVARNLIGKPVLYPEYGDFSASYSMQTYGLWWKICPSASQYIDDNVDHKTIAIDFVDVKFEIPVQPLRVDIYETYNPGSVIRIWGALEGQIWILLWSGEASQQPAQARIFSPPIIEFKKFINLLRLEFNQSCQDYYSALDAIVLVGSGQVPAPNVFQLKSITSRLQNSGFLNLSLTEEDVLSGVKYILSDNFTKSLEILNDEEEENSVCWRVSHQCDVSVTTQSDEAVGDVSVASQSDEAVGDVSVASQSEPLEGGYFSMLPEELILHILKQTGIESLCRLAQTCKIMKMFVSQSILYQQLNLKNCWWIVTNRTLEWLTPRCQQLKAIDLSWCGGYDVISSQSFMEFINQCGFGLSILHLNNCQFIDNYCLYIIANTCSNLEVLSLSSCSKIDQLGFGELKKLTKLKFLDLSRTKIEFRNLHILLQHMTQLNHLLLNSCKSLDLDEVALTLATFNPRLISLGAWKTWPLTSRGLRALACLKSLRELDLGWTLSGTITEGLGELVRECPDLEKLFLTAHRTMTDNDVGQMVAHAHNLQQLDIMGTRNISPEAVYSLLQKCEKLRLLDVSYCEQIHYSLIQKWSVLFPNVSIKGGLKHQVRLI